jgi:hypothetical protein
VDNLQYYILGDDDLHGSDEEVLEILVQSDEVNQFPLLGDYDGNPGQDYEYKSFRLVKPDEYLPNGFIRVEVVASPDG